MNKEEFGRSFTQGLGIGAGLRVGIETAVKIVDFFFGDDKDE